MDSKSIVSALIWVNLRPDQM